MNLTEEEDNRLDRCIMLSEEQLDDILLYEQVRYDHRASRTNTAFTFA